MSRAKPISWSRSASSCPPRRAPGSRPAPRRQLRVERARDLVEEHDRGRIARARTIATRCCWPRRAVGILLRLVGEAEALEQLQASSLACLSERVENLARRRRPFRSTLMCGKRLKAWKTIPISRRTAFRSTPRAGHFTRRERRSAHVDRLEPVHAAKECRLAGARRADQADDLVFREAEVDPGEHLDSARSSSRSPSIRRASAFAASASCRRRSRSTGQSVNRASGMVTRDEDDRRCPCRRCS